MSKFGGRPYWQWVELARRWQEAVDWGSPTTAWTKEMIDHAVTNPDDYWKTPASVFRRPTNRHLSKGE